MPDHLPYGHDTLVIPAFFVTGDDMAELERWKREHPDWFVAGTWTTSAPPQARDRLIPVAWPWPSDSRRLPYEGGSPIRGGGNSGPPPRAGGPAGERAPCRNEASPLQAPGAEYAPDPATPEQRAILRRELERSGELAPGDGREAHHIVPQGGPGQSGARDPIPSQQVLSNAGIQSGSAENGVGLSRAFYRRVHTADYYRFVETSLREVKTRQETVHFLQSMARRLREEDLEFQATGRMPLWMGIRP